MNKDKLEIWYSLREQLAEVKAAEAALRDEIVADVFGENIAEGTHKKAIGEGFALVVNVKYNRKLDQEVLDRLPVSLVQKATKTARSLNKKAYELLSDVDRGLMDEAVITTPAKPALNIKEIK